MSDFKPTHRHAEGGLYQKLGPVRVKVSTEWQDCTLYRNEAGQLFARHDYLFFDRFTPLEGLTKAEDW